MKKSNRGLNKGELIIPGLALLFAVSYLVQTTDAPSVAIKWPYVVTGITAVFWLVILVKNIFKADHTESVKGSVDISKPLMMILVPVGYLVVLPYLGFVISSFLFLLTLFRLLGSQSWRLNTVIALLLALFLQIMLITFLDMSLPRLEIMGIAI